ncbi:MAG: TrkA family potassium uptake protein [Dehalococcoidia bacterium]|nr:TrkA family potassium uptake protein [Dehalococcoidia bacterium]MCA9824852.1 TrkA family potassium uptake protein [Dehalococcoidia bacterium]MCA9844066.1 TrkA family potassium uptake protein [Dehalococcoidia bacterium]
MDVAILGLGRFGTQLSQELVSIGVQVLAVDSDPARVNSIVEDVFLAAEGNVTNVEFLESLGLHSYDSVVVAIGSDVATSVLVTLTLKQRLRHRHVVSKARDSEHARALELAGADTVVNPEYEAAVRLAHTLGSRSVSDYMSLSGDHGIARVKAPGSAEGIKVEDLDTTRRYKVFLLARMRGEQVSFNPDLDEVVESGDIWIVAGNDKDIRALQR